MMSMANVIIIMSLTLKKGVINQMDTHKAASDCVMQIL